MQSTTINQRIETYIRANWFKLLMVSLIIFIFLRKDFSFSVNLNSPDQVEEEMAPLKEDGPTKKGDKKKPQMTVKHEVEKTGPATNKFEMFDIPIISHKGGSATIKKSEFFQVDESTRQSYIKRFAKVAINERKKFGVPASIILGNALLHSGAGTRDMAVRGNNHFGLPCTTNWRGESGTYNDACYRHYENAWTSFRDHSLYLTTGSTSHMVKLGFTDYKAWAKEMEKVSVFELDNLAEQLINVIETYQLQQLDTM